MRARRNFRRAIIPPQEGIARSMEDRDIQNAGEAGSSGSNAELRANADSAVRRRPTLGIAWPGGSSKAGEDSGNGIDPA